MTTLTGEQRTELLSHIQASRWTDVEAFCSDHDITLHLALKQICDEANAAYDRYLGLMSKADLLANDALSRQLYHMLEFNGQLDEAVTLMRQYKIRLSLAVNVLSKFRPTIDLDLAIRDDGLTSSEGSTLALVFDLTRMIKTKATENPEDSVWPLLLS